MERLVLTDKLRDLQEYVAGLKSHDPLESCVHHMIEELGTARMAPEADAKPGVLQKWGYPLINGADDADEIQL